LSVKRRASAELAYGLLTSFSELPITGYVNGPYETTASLLYEELTGRAGFTAGAFHCAGQRGPNAAWDGEKAVSAYERYVGRQDKKQSWTVAARRLGFSFARYARIVRSAERMRGPRCQ